MLLRMDGGEDSRDIRGSDTSHTATRILPWRQALSGQVLTELSMAADLETRSKARPQ